MFSSRIFAGALAIAVLTGAGYAAGPFSDIDASGLPSAKQTSLGLYVSSERAFKIVTDAPETLFIDVRDPMEVAVTGHPSGVDKIVPVRVQSDLFDAELGEFMLVPNTGFLKQMDAALADAGKSRHDLIIITCGSGYRSARAVELLASAGYTNVWHIPDGYAGDEKPGMNARNAWQNAGLPWSDDLVAKTPWIKAVRVVR